MATARSVVACRAIRGLRIYFERLDTVGAGNEPKPSYFGNQKIQEFCWWLILARGRTIKLFSASVTA